MKAILKNYRQSPRKVRLVASAVKGKSVDQAILSLKFMPKRATEVIEKLIKSAAANAKENFEVAEDLVVKNIEINKGVTIKRFRPRARGSAYRINKRTSNIVVTLAPKAASTKSTPKAESVEVKAVPKKAVKKVAKKKTVKKVAPKADK
jgi:large subunit ribosomal protein L22